ncbi:MAG: oxidative damage protection protein [Gammaproteobacteria bacterium]|nr:oxidative damage protection protein [Gammaproteobacteria bacterium]
MTRLLFCDKLQREAPGLTTPPFPGPMGEKIYQHISQEAWNLWIKQQTILINENRLSTLEPSARQYLREEMEKFLFGV